MIFFGKSMAPFLRDGDQLYVQKTPWNRLRIGNLVVCEPSSSKHPVIHRLVGWQYRINTQFGILKGDSLLYKDSFFLTPHNYLGRVWARERNGKRLLLNSLCADIRARFIALFSIFNLTPGILRLKTKRILELIGLHIPGIKTLERSILANVRYFVFSEQRNTKRLRAVFRGITIGEIIFQDNSLKVIRSTVFSVFSAIIPPENLVSDAAARFPELFLADLKKNVVA